jgi:predicted transcriptional regulator
MDPSDDALFLSLRPEYAELLLEGRKTVELRRIRPRAPVGTVALLYASSPQRELLGVCTVAAIGEATPDQIWKLHGSKTGICRTDFRTYFHGASRAVAITVTNPERFVHPISLARMRSEWINFQPPQSFRYVSHVDALRLLEGQTSILQEIQVVR